MTVPKQSPCGVNYLQRHSPQTSGITCSWLHRGASAWLQPFLAPAQQWSLLRSLSILPFFLINRMEGAFSALLTSTPPPPVKGLLLDKFYIVSFPFSWNRRDQHSTRGPASQKSVLSGSTEWSAGKHNGAAEHSTTTLQGPRTSQSLI